MPLFEFWNSPGSIGFFKVFQILAACEHPFVGMERSTFGKDRHHGINGRIMRHGGHHRFMPLQVDVGGLGTKIWSFRCQVVLLVGVAEKIEQHFHGKQMESIMPGSHP